MPFNEQNRNYRQIQSNFRPASGMGKLVYGGRVGEGRVLHVNNDICENHSTASKILAVV